MKRIFTISVITVLLVSLVPIPYTVSAADPPTPSEVWVDDDWQIGVPPYAEDTDGDNVFATIQAGIDAVDQGGTVNVTAGTYYENIEMKSGVIIMGEGADVTIIDGEGSGSVVTGNNIGPDARLEGFTITGGSGTDVAGPNTGIGGGIYLQNSAAIIANSIIEDNNVDLYGGGILIDHYHATSSPQIINCLIIDNIAGVYGGGIFVSTSSSPTIMNSTIADNSAITAGGGVYNYEAFTTITNTIIYRNTTNNIPSGDTSTVTYSFIEGGWSGDGNIGDYPDDKPLFVGSVGSGDYHLQPDSPCIDTGTSAGAPEFDLDDVSRPQGVNVDIGAYEYPFIANYTLAYTAGANGSITGTSPQTVASGADGTAVTAVADAGYHFVDWSDASTANPRTDTNVTADISVTANFVDKTPPEISISVSPDTLWPSNHKMVEIIATVAVSDTGDPSPTVVLISIVSNEPDDANGDGDGNIMNDIQGADIGAEDYVFLLRAERDGSGNGRVYTITYTATDASGNSAIAIITVTVPHDLGKKAKK